MNRVRVVSTTWLRRFPARVSLHPPRRRITVNVVIPYERDAVALTAKAGQTVKDLVDEHERLKAYLECACDGNAACSTCHVIVDAASFAKLVPPEQAELDMIDLAWGVTETSRLGCQMALTDTCDGITLTIPKQANNLMEPEIFFDR